MSCWHQLTLGVSVDLALTTDGKQLLTILFDKDESLDLMILSLEMPTDRELELLFAEMDTNEDHVRAHCQ